MAHCRSCTGREQRWDSFYVIERGEKEVSKDGHTAARLGRGDFFGEIALLRDVLRTATVAARTGLRLFALERGDFLEAVRPYAERRGGRCDNTPADRRPLVRPLKIEALLR